MSDVGTALAVFSAVGVATADFLVTLAVNAVKREYRKRTAMMRKREEGKRRASWGGERAERATCATHELCSTWLHRRAHRVNVAASRAQLASDNEHSKVNTATKGSGQTRLSFPRKARQARRTPRKIT